MSGRGASGSFQSTCKSEINSRYVWHDWASLPWFSGREVGELSGGFFAGAASIDWAGERWAIEIKLTSLPTRTMIKGLQKAADLTGASRRILLCKTAEEIRSDSLLITNLPSFLKEFVQTNHQNHGAHAKPRRCRLLPWRDDLRVVRLTWATLRAQ